MSKATKHWLTVNNLADRAEILIEGQIGKSWWDDSGMSAQEFNEMFNEIPKDKPILIRINSEGGSVKDGLGIYNAIKDRRDSVTCRVDGYALSIASVIPLAASRIVSPKSAIWMIHEPWSVTQGNADDHLRAAEMLEQHANVLVDLYAEGTGKTADEIREAMKRETWIRGSQAVEWGLADEMSDESVALNYLDVTKINAKHIPDDILSEVAPRVQNQNEPVVVTPQPSASQTTPQEPTSDDLQTKITELELQLVESKATAAALQIAVDAAKADADQKQQFLAEIESTSHALAARCAEHELIRARARVQQAVQARVIDEQDRAAWIERLKNDPSEYAVIDNLPCQLGTAPIPLPKIPSDPTKKTAGELTGLARAIAAHAASKKQ